MVIENVGGGCQYKELIRLENLEISLYSSSSCISAASFVEHDYEFNGKWRAKYPEFLMVRFI